jgi:hypothetical protein
MKRDEHRRCNVTMLCIDGEQITRYNNRYREHGTRHATSG